jgi:hypothetical protein
MVVERRMRKFRLRHFKHKKKALPFLEGPVVVPGAGIEPARLAAGDFLTTSAFAAPHMRVRGLEHAFTIVFRL